MIITVLICTLIAVNYSEQYKLILRHKSTSTGVFSGSIKSTGVENAGDLNQNTYSIIGNLDPNDFQAVNHKYQFKLVYYDMDDSITELVWKQSSWLTEATITGYEAIAIPVQTACLVGNSCRFYGLGLSSHGCSYLDGDASVGPSWFNSVGSTCLFNDGFHIGIPAFNHEQAKGEELYVMDSSNNENTCNKDTVISHLGNVLCHYSSVNAHGGFIPGSVWIDISGNGNDLIDGTDFTGLTYYGSNEDYVSNHPSATGYIKFPTACNLAANGDYTLFTASMYYGNAPQGSRAFGNCNDNTFVSGWYQPDFATSDKYQWQLSGRRGNYELHSEYYNINGWAIISDTMNSMRLNGREITHEIPVFDKLGNQDVQICFNYVNGATTNAPYRIKEYIVFDETLNNDERRCVEEYIFDKHNFWQHLTGLAPK